MDISFKNLEVWKNAIELAKKILHLDLPELFELQVQQAVISISANIAEGIGRGEGGIVYPLRIARGSLCEVESFLLLLQQLKKLKMNDLNQIFDLITTIESQLIEMVFQLKLTKNKSQIESILSKF